MIYKLLSQRRKEAEGGIDEVFQYDEAPNKLRIQVQQILSDALGYYYTPDAYDYDLPDNNIAWETIQKILCREFGTHSLSRGSDSRQDLLNFLSGCSIENFLDAIEVCCRYIENVLGDKPEYQLSSLSVKQMPSDAINEINHRFYQSALGYQFESGALIRADSSFAHAEIIKPAITLLNNKKFKGSQEEFLCAHRFYRNEDYGQAIVEAGKAFESALKSTCDQKGWRYEAGSRASDLLRVIRKNELWPSYLDKSFEQLVATLSSGLPQLRNNAGAHGAGNESVAVSRSMVEYALNLCASKIIFLAHLSSD